MRNAGLQRIRNENEMFEFIVRQRLH